MKLKKLTGALATSLLLASGSALAEPFYINVNNFDTTPLGGTDGVTANIFELSVDFFSTSTYTDDDGNAGITVGDSVNDVGSGTVSAYLNSGGSAIVGGEGNEGVGVTHSLRFDYNNLAGTIGAIDNLASPIGILANFTSGTINVYNDNNADGDNTDAGEGQILTLNVFASAGTIGNAIIFATVANPQAGTWFFADGTDWSNLVVAINMRLDTNVDPQSEPVFAGVVNGFDTYSRGSNLNGSVSFNRVPEPGVLALLGIGLVGIGLGRRAKKAA